MSSVPPVDTSIGSGDEEVKNEQSINEPQVIPSFTEDKKEVDETSIMASEPENALENKEINETGKTETGSESKEMNETSKTETGPGNTSENKETNETGKMVSEPENTSENKEINETGKTETESENISECNETVKKENGTENTSENKEMNETNKIETEPENTLEIKSSDSKEPNEPSEIKSNDGNNDDSSSSSDESDISDDDDDPIPHNLTGNNNENENENDDDGDDDDDDDEEDDSDKSKNQSGIPRTKNEILSTELPDPDPFPERIGDDDEVSEIGAIYNLTDNLIIVQSNKGNDPIDEGGLLCFEDRTTLGRIDEVFGPVSQPFYTVRLGRNATVDSARVYKGRKVFVSLAQSAPIEMREITAQKGSDASGLYDEEPAPEDLDYSDDEEEAAAKQRIKFEKLAKREGISLDEYLKKHNKQLRPPPQKVFAGADDYYDDYGDAIPPYPDRRQYRMNDYHNQQQQQQQYYRPPLPPPQMYQPQYYPPPQQQLPQYYPPPQQRQQLPPQQQPNMQYPPQPGYYPQSLPPQQYYPPHQPPPPQYYPPPPPPQYPPQNYY